ncbi:MAG: OmpA family protein [Oceanospirillaceae bacterium]
MKKLAITASMAFAMTLSASAMAHQQNHGYVTNSNGAIWRTSNGNCLKHSTWTNDDTAACDGTTPVTPAVVAAVDAAKKFAVFFDFDSAAVGNISHIAQYVNGLTEVSNVNLVGHADPIGDNAYNMALSQRRAVNVANALTEAGVKPSSISVDYQGESAPVAQCSGRGAELISCLRADRRVNVEIAGKS